jgi:hypothetical protein
MEEDKHKLLGSTKKIWSTDRKRRLILTEEDLLPGLEHGEDKRRLEPHASSPEELTELGLWTTCEGMIRFCGWQMGRGRNRGHDRADEGANIN